jgi:hypothetical protein
MDWLIYNKGAMHFSTIEKALRENKQLKQNLEEASAREESSARSGAEGAEIVTDPELKELIRYLENNPLFKHQLLINFHRHKQGGQKTEPDETPPFE